jgi:hypothetical protein
MQLWGYPIELSPTQPSSGRYVELMMVGRDGRFAR